MLVDSYGRAKNQVPGLVEGKHHSGYTRNLSLRFRQNAFAVFVASVLITFPLVQSIVTGDKLFMGLFGEGV